MNVYLITRNRADWDEYVSAVVVSSSPVLARALAAQELGSERQWGTPRIEFTDPARSTCEKVCTYDGRRTRPFIVHHHFLAG